MVAASRPEAGSRADQQQVHATLLPLGGGIHRLHQVLENVDPGPLPTLGAGVLQKKKINLCLRLQ